MDFVEDDEIKRIKRGLSWTEIKEALESEGCPVCYIMLKAIKKYFDTLLYEYVLDAGVHKKMIESMGLCNTHTYMLISAEEKLFKEDRLGIASLYETSLKKEIKQINKVTNLKIKDRSKRRINFIENDRLSEYKSEIFEQMKTKGQCIGCELQKHNESFYTHELIKLYKDSEFCKLFERNEIFLCRLHLLYLINESDNDFAITYFVSTQNEKLNRMKFQLSEYIRKHDYHFRKDLTDEERKSCAKVLEYFGSKENISREGYNNLFSE